MTRTKQKISKSKNIEDEARYWDTHGTMDFEDKSKLRKVQMKQILRNPTCEGIASARASFRKGHLQHIYEGLDSFRGSGPKGVTDVSTTIDDSLYGNRNASKGMDGK